MKTSDLQSICNVQGSSHILKTCKIGPDKFFLKFSEEDLFGPGVDPNLQILVEFLAYRIYGLYPGVKIPGAIHLVADPDLNKVGLATQAIAGKHGKTISSKRQLGKLMTAGVFVDIFLANWDVLGENQDNVIVAGDAHRIDPGGALTFRAQGGRKGGKFNPKASELKSMLDPGLPGGAGAVLQYSDAKKAAKAFLAVAWPQVANRIKETHKEVLVALGEANMSSKGWMSEVSHISKVLKQRHKVVTNHCKFVLTADNKKPMTEDIKNVYPTKNTEKSGDTGNLWDDGQGPEGGAKAFDQSRKKVLGDLKEFLAFAIKEVLVQEQQGTTGTAPTQPAAKQPGQTPPEDRKAAMERAKAAQTPEAQAQAAKEFHQAETQAGEEHLKQLQAQRDAEMAKKDAERQKSQRAKPAQPVALPKQGLSQQFQDAVQKYYQQITTAPGLDQKKREQLIARLGQIQLAPEGSEQSKLGQIQSLVKGSLGSERVDFGQIAQQHAPQQQQQQFQPQQPQGFLGKTKKLFGLNEATLKASLEID